MYQESKLMLIRKTNISQNLKLYALLISCGKIYLNINYIILLYLNSVDSNGYIGVYVFYFIRQNEKTEFLTQLILLRIRLIYFTLYRTIIVRYIIET